MSYRSNKKNTV